MKRFFVLFQVVLLLSVNGFAQSTTTPPDEITNRNSWLKFGLNVGLPVGDIANVSNLVAGAELKGQLMQTNHIGIGLTTGYNHYFPKTNFSSFGTIPAGAFVRYYPTSNGFFLGTDLGYNFLTGSASNNNGGFYVKPQLGYHSYAINVFGYYENTFVSNVNGGYIANAGIGATYNIRFK